jgi:YVTN family beta-propeller protein
VVNRDANNVSVIAAGAVTNTIPVGSQPGSLGINDVSGRTYVANLGSNTVTVIDGATKATTTITAGAQPGTVAIDKIRNKIYVTNGNGLCLTVIDGKTNAATIVGDVGNGTEDVAVNVLANKVYVMTANPSGSSVSAFSGALGALPQSLLNQLITATSGTR